MKKILRTRVEVFVFRKDKVLITVNHGPMGVPWYGIPGGGVDPGEDPAEAAAREVLEEVGIRVKNLKPTGHVSVKTDDLRHMSKERASTYSGSTTHLFRAEYDGVDKSILGQDNDAVNYIWTDPEKAFDLLAGNTGPHQHEFLKELIKV